MALLFLLGRIIVGYYFLSNAYSHIFKSAHMTGYAASKGIKSPKNAVIGSGLLLFIGGLSILFGVAPHWGILALIVFMVPVTFKMHNYWKETEPVGKMNQKIAFAKNMAIIGFLLMLLAIPVPWIY